MKKSLCGVLIAAAVSAVQAAAQAAPIRHVVLSVASTNDEWTTTGLSVTPQDILILAVPGTIRVGAMTGEVDATGANPGSRSSSGFGILEFKIGVGAGKPAGKFSLLRPESSGELKFRVKDTRYDDNSGAFEVEVIVIPEGAIPPARRVGEQAPADFSLESARTERAAIFQVLRSLLVSQETFFTDSNRYAARISSLPRVQIPSTMTVKSFVGATSSWKAVVTSSRLPGVECAIAVGTVNPLGSNAGEGEPICR
jgi:hypothetical protein